MMSIGLHKKAVASFDRCLMANDGDNNDGAPDGGVYVFDVDCLSDRSAIVASTSDNYLSLYDSETLNQIRKMKVHTEMINGFDLSKGSPNLIFTASNDHRIYGWDIRTSGDVPIIKLKFADDVTAISVGISDTLIAAGCGSAISFYDIRGGDNWTTGKKSTKLGEYSDIHTDAITQLKFSRANSQILVSGAEDGLISIFNTSAADGDDAVVSILNAECPVRRLGFFGCDDEALYCLSTTETASFWHCATAQRVGDFPNVREELAVDYLVDCMYDNYSDCLSVIAGNYDGTAKIAVVEPTSLRITGELTLGGHSATVRCGKYVSSSSGRARLITGGEDATVCSWYLDSGAAESSMSNTDGPTSSVGQKSNNGPTMKSTGGPAKKVERRQKPY